MVKGSQKIRGLRGKKQNPGQTEEKPPIVNSPNVKISNVKSPIEKPPIVNSPIVKSDDQWSEAFGHQPVLLTESIEALAIKPDGFYVDATLGGGGHSRAILAALGPKGRLLAIDVDPEPLAWAQKWAQGDSRLILKRLNFRDLVAFLEREGLGAADGILADLGVSLRQLTDSSRGLSFAADGPLDMRLDPESNLKAMEIVNHWDENELKTIFWRLGEERAAGRLAHQIVELREKEPFTSTAALAELARRSLFRPGPPPRIHPATRMFMALRMAVNHEIESLSKFLSDIRLGLKPGGRLVVISFHSLEDRLVKQALRGSGEEQDSSELFIDPSSLKRPPERNTPWRLHRKKVIRPSKEELALNPRARSAKLRWAEAM